MNTLTTAKRENTKMALFICAMSLLVVGTMYFAVTGAFADNAALSGVLNTLKLVLTIICSVVGVIFAIVGIVKIAIAHANEDGPAHSKAAMMIATGIVLVILGAGVINNLPIDTWISVPSGE